MAYTPNTTSRPAEQPQAMIKYDASGIILTAEAKNVLTALYPPEEHKQILAMSVAVGMAPDNLALQDNVKTLYRAYGDMCRLGVQPGVHFYMVPFKEKGTNLSRYSYVYSLDYLAGNVEAYCRLQSAQAGRHIAATLQFKIVKNKAEIEEAIDFYGPEGVVHDPQDRAVFARYVRVIDGRPEMRADEGWDGATCCGIYLHKGVRREGSNGSYITASDSKMLMGNVPNRTALTIARDRAQRQAAKEFVNRELLPVDGRSVQERIDAFVQIVRERPYDQREVAGLLDAGEEYSRPEEVDTKGLFLEKPIQYEEDGDVIYATSDPRKAPKAKAVVAPAPEPEVEAEPEIEDGQFAAEEDEVDPDVEVATPTLQDWASLVWKELPDEHKKALAPLEGACKEPSKEIGPKAKTKLQQRLAEACGCAVGDEIEGHRVVDVVWTAIAGSPLMTDAGLKEFAELTGAGDPWKMHAKSPTRSALEAAYAVVVTQDTGDGF